MVLYRTEKYMRQIANDQRGSAGKSALHLSGCFSILVLLFLTALPLFAQKKIVKIQFGWDYKDVRELHSKLDSMQELPFDGLCFSLQRRITEAFDKEFHDEKFYNFDLLQSMDWGKYTENYIILRGVSKTGGNWYDDKGWQTIVTNMQQLSKAVQLSGAKGILFDPEYYYADTMFNPWTYSEAQYPGKTFEAVQLQVRKRGMQFVQAIQQYKSDFNFLSLWLVSLIIEDKKIAPLQATRHALLIPFFEGMLLAKKENLKIIDGNEYAYGYMKPSQFLESPDKLKNSLVNLMSTRTGKKLAAEITVAQPIFYDGLMATKPAYNKGVPPNWNWTWLAENLKYASLTSSSGIIWFYNQNLDWWQQKIPDTLVAIIKDNQTIYNKQKSKTIQHCSTCSCENINTNSGCYYHLDGKKPMRSGKKAFTFEWDKSNRCLQISFIEKIPLSVSIFINNQLVQTIRPAALLSNTKLKGMASGKQLSLLARYEDNAEANGIQYY